MKAINYISILTLFVLLFSSCELDYYPKDELSSEKVSGNPELLGNVLIGGYSRLDEWNYSRSGHFLDELHSDDVTWVKNSGAAINRTYGYQPYVNHGNAQGFWILAYEGIYSTNKVIENIADDAEQELLQLKGEALFLRAKFHFDLVRVFSRPYTHDDPSENLGIPIKKSTDDNLPPRSSVKETYEFIVSDFLKAAELMDANKPSIYGSKQAAWAYLSRIYLYMEQNEKAIEYADKVINSGKYQLVSTDNLGDYYTLVPENNPETIFAIKRVPAENKGKGSISSLYNEEGGGWGEIPLSKPFVELIYENPNDKRIEFIEPKYVRDEDGNKIPDPDDPTGYQVEKRLGYPKYFNVKYTRQQGIPMLSSPVQIRLAEMYLNKAEAYAKLGEDQNAIDNVNILRERAGLSGVHLYTTSDLHGYDSVLDVVLVERRLELFVEGHRSFDLFRNHRGVDRSYTHGEGWAGPQFIPYTSNRIVELIPERVMRLNPQMEQNPLPE